MEVMMAPNVMMSSSNQNVQMHSSVGHSMPRTNSAYALVRPSQQLTINESNAADYGLAWNVHANEFVPRQIHGHRQQQFCEAPPPNMVQFVSNGGQQFAVVQPVYTTNAPPRVYVRSHSADEKHGLQKTHGPPPSTVVHGEHRSSSQAAPSSNRRLSQAASNERLDRMVHDMRSICSAAPYNAELDAWLDSAMATLAHNSHNRQPSHDTLALVNSTLFNLALNPTASIVPTITELIARICCERPVGDMYVLRCLLPHCQRLHSQRSKCSPAQLRRQATLTAHLLCVPWRRRLTPLAVLVFDYVDMLLFENMIRQYPSSVSIENLQCAIYILLTFGLRLDACDGARTSATMDKINALCNDPNMAATQRLNVTTRTQLLTIVNKESVAWAALNTSIATAHYTNVTQPESPGVYAVTI